MGHCPTCGQPIKHDETTLAGFLRARREERGLSLRAVAKITGDAISCPYLSQVEMGHIADISARKLMALADAYGLDPGALMRLAAGGEYRPPMPDTGKRCFTYCGDDKCDCGLNLGGSVD